MASSPQSWDWLENRRSKDDKVSRRMWKAVKAKAGEVRVIEEEEGKKWEKKKQKEEEKKKKK